MKFKYLSVCVGSRYISTVIVPFKLEIKVSKKAIGPFCSCSMVKEMCWSMKLRLSRKVKTAFFLVIANTSSMYSFHFLNGVNCSLNGDYRILAHHKNKLR